MKNEDTFALYEVIENDEGIIQNFRSEDGLLGKEDISDVIENEKEEM